MQRHQTSRDSAPCIGSQRKSSVFGGNELSSLEDLHLKLRDYQSQQLNNEESLDLLHLASGFAQHVLMLQNELKGQ